MPRSPENFTTQIQVGLIEGSWVAVSCCSDLLPNHRIPLHPIALTRDPAMCHRCFAPLPLSCGAGSCTQIFGQIQSGPVAPSLCRCRSSALTPEPLRASVLSDPAAGFFEISNVPCAEQNWVSVESALILKQQSAPKSRPRASQPTMLA